DEDELGGLLLRDRIGVLDVSDLWTAGGAAGAALAAAVALETSLRFVDTRGVLRANSWLTLALGAGALVPDAGWTQQPPPRLTTAWAEALESAAHVAPDAR